MLHYGELFMLHDLHRQGLSVRAIAKRMGLDRKTVRRYLQQGLEPPVYGPRQPRPSCLEPYHDYLQARVLAYPELSAKRLLREVRDLGYPGGYTLLTDYLQQVRPPAASGFEHRFETPPGRQGQVDFAHFKAVFSDAPQAPQVVWLFSLVLGHSRYLYAQFVLRQDLATLIRCHLAAFAELGGVPQHLLYDRLKTAVLGQDEAGQVQYHRTLLDLAHHYGFTPKACAPYRAKTKGKVERPFRYVRQDFFLGRSFRNLEDLNQQLTTWRHTLANQRRHGTTQQIVQEAFVAEQPTLQPLPAVAFSSVLKLERRITWDGLVSVGGNYYSVPDTTRRRVVEVQVLAQEIRIYEEEQLIAVHAPLPGRGQRSLAAGHRRWPPPGPAQAHRHPRADPAAPSDESVTRRSLEVYEAIGAALAGRERRGCP
jgi:transposase